MNEKALLLLKLLEKGGDEFQTSESLARILQVSTRTVLRQMKLLALEGSEYGFLIDTQKGRGFILKVVDEGLFSTLPNLPAPPADSLAERAVSALLLDGRLKLEELAQEANYSRSTVGRMSDQLAARLSPYGLFLERKPHQGLVLCGPERNRRAALLRLVLGDLTLDQACHALKLPSMDMAALCHAVYDTAKRLQLTPSEDNVEQFTLIFLLSIARFARGNAVSFAEASLPPAGIVREANREAMRTLLCLHGSLQSSAPPEDELLYLTLAFEQSFYSVTQSSARYQAARAFYDDIIRRAFRRIQAAYGTDLAGDTLLGESLGRHLSTSLGHYLLGLEGDNPFGERVQERYPIAHHYTLELAAELRDNTGIPVAKNELGYLTLHIASALERGEASYTVRAAIVCSTAFGTASLLRSLLLKKGTGVDIVGIYALHEVEQLRLPVDFFISTLPLPQQEIQGVPVVQISPFLSERDEQALSAAIAQTTGSVALTDYFVPDVFFLFDKPMKKESLLDTMCEALIVQGKMTPEERERVFERERIASTEIAPGVAMPHCLVARESFLAFAVCRQGVQWGSGWVKLVMLGCFHAGDAQVKDLLLQIYRTFSDEAHVSALQSCADYASFYETMKSQIGNRRPGHAEEKFY